MQSQNKLEVSWYYPRLIGLGNCPCRVLAQRPKPEDAELKSPRNHGKLLYTRWNLDLNKDEARKVFSGNRNIYTSQIKRTADVKWILQDLGKRYSTVNVVFKCWFAFQKLFNWSFDPAEISMIFAILFAKRLHFDQPVAITFCKSCKVSAKVTCVCPCTQENLEFLATKSKCIVSLNKMFDWKTFLSIIQPILHKWWWDLRNNATFCKHGLICISELKSDILQRVGIFSNFRFHGCFLPNTWYVTLVFYIRIF